MKNGPIITIESLREVILATAADKSVDQSEGGRAAAQSVAIESMSAISAQYSNNELQHELYLYLEQLKNS